MAASNHNDPNILLSFNPAAVAIRAASNPTTLQNLEAFAFKLSNYINFVKLNVATTTTTTSAATSSATSFHGGKRQ